MTPEDIDELRREAEDWKTRWGAPMPAGQSQAMATSVLKLVEHAQRLQGMLVEALDVIDSCPEHPDKNQFTNFIEDLRLQVEGFKG